uniref:Uncharacterized protein n=1 Tax=Phenylobacterium glaciei TaxID=2803784 RepID=A0A974P1V8_9CAUL|nr:hypothetical protein JKL49_18855 [Phenylobacterium glaciei]
MRGSIQLILAVGLLALGAASGAAAKCPKPRYASELAQASASAEVQAKALQNLSDQAKSCLETSRR